MEMLCMKKISWTSRGCTFVKRNPRFISYFLLLKLVYHYFVLAISTNLFNNKILTSKRNIILTYFPILYDDYVSEMSKHSFVNKMITLLLSKLFGRFKSFKLTKSVTTQLRYEDYKWRPTRADLATKLRSFVSRGRLIFSCFLYPDTSLVFTHIWNNVVPLSNGKLYYQVYCCCSIFKTSAEMVLTEMSVLWLEKILFAPC